jgi:hypothetical protein
MAFNSTLFTAHRRDDFEQPHDKLYDLGEEIEQGSTKYGAMDSIRMVDYIHKIHEEYARIINADEKEMLMLINEFEDILPHENFETEFWEDIVEAMRYQSLREKEFIIFLNALGIKTCVYCHCQLLPVIHKTANAQGENDWKALLELDHRHAKSKYPFLCTSFFNLYPVCAPCNKAKSNSQSNFDLYDLGPEFNVFRFSLKNSALVDYWADPDQTKLEVQFNHIEPDEGPNDQLAIEYEEMFNVQKIYNTQKDIVEELIHKQQVYTAEYNSDLLTAFRGIFPDKGMYTRLVIGTYTNEEDVFKRPMSKFIQDISKDIGLIDDDGNLVEGRRNSI